MGAVALDFSKMQPINAPPPQGGVTLDFSKAVPIGTGSSAQPGFSLRSVLSGTDPAHRAIDAAAQTVPIDMSSLGAAAKTTAQDLGAGAVRVAQPFLHPVDAVGGILKAGGQLATGGSGAIYDLNGPAAAAVKPFVQNPSGEAVAAIPAAVATAFAPGESPAASKALESITPEGGAVEAPIAAARSIGSKLLPSFVDGPPESLLTRAIKPGKNNVNWNSDVQSAIPLMKSAEQQLGHPIAGVDDALAAADLAKKQIWQQYQQRLGPAAQMGATVDGNTIADAMMSSIDKRTAIQNPGLVAKVKAVADTYRKPLSLNDAEDFLQSANKDLNSYYAKNKVGQNVAQNDPEISSTVAEAGALRDALYSKLDQVSGPGAAQLKQAYGAVSNVQKELYGRQLVAARQNPVSLSEQLSTVAGAGKIAKGVVTLNPGDVLEGAQNIAVARGLKAHNSSDAMIERAFKAAQPAAPFPMPSSAFPTPTWQTPNPASRPLLPRGAIQIPAADASGRMPYTPPPVAMDTTAARMGRLLPAQSGAPTILPYSPQMSGGERIAALMQMLRKQPQPALPARASAIPLPPPS